MDSYDSDSSGLEDDGDYTETAVLLGYSSTEPTGDSISKLGGWPVCPIPNFPLGEWPFLKQDLTYCAVVV